MFKLRASIGDFRVSRAEVGHWPSALAIVDKSVAILESGDGNLAVYNVDTARREQLVRLSGHTSVISKQTLFGGNLLRLDSGAFLTILLGTRSQMVHIDNEGYRPVAQLNDKPLREWAYCAGQDTVFASCYDLPGVWLTRISSNRVTFLPLPSAIGRIHFLDDGTETLTTDDVGDHVYLLETRNGRLKRTYSLPESIIADYPLTSRVHTYATPQCVVAGNRTLYLAPQRSDPTGSISPVVAMNLRNGTCDVIDAGSTRGVYRMQYLQVHHALLLSGMDDTALVDLQSGAKTLLWPSRLTDVVLSSDERWVIGIDAAYETLVLLDLFRQTWSSIELSGLQTFGEFISAPLAFLDQFNAVVADVASHELVSVRLPK